MVAVGVGLEVLGLVAPVGGIVVVVVAATVVVVTLSVVVVVIVVDRGRRRRRRSFLISKRRMLTVRAHSPRTVSLSSEAVHYDLASQYRPSVQTIAAA